MTDPQQRTIEAVLNQFLQQFLDDQARGSIRSIEEYQVLFPDHKAEIACEYGRLIEAKDLPKTDVRAEAVPSSISLDQPFGPYRLLQILGRGGQGIVYKAEDTRLKRMVALKMLTRWSALSQDAQSRFEREALAASRLDDPGLCTLYEAGMIDQVPYIAMRYLEGRTLADLIAEERSRISVEGAVRGIRLRSTDAAGVPEILEMFERIARSLHRAHEGGIVHRDIKPGNVMLCADGLPVILDFGLAQIIGDDTPSITQSGSTVGTPSYMSPEQINLDSRRLDRRTDVYSLAATLYECLTLRPPFQAPTAERLFHEIRESEPQDPRDFNASVDADLVVILKVALAKDRQKRYQSSLDLAEDLRRHRAHEPILARPPSKVYQFRRFVRRHVAWVSGAAAVFFVMLVGMILTLQQMFRARVAETLAFERLEQVNEALQTAQTETAIAKEINDFLNDKLLRAATPEMALGASLTVRDVLDLASKQLEGRFLDQPLIRAGIHSTIGNAYLSLALYGSAEFHLRQALDLRTRSLGNAAVATLQSTRQLSYVIWEMGQRQEARSLVTDALLVSRATFGPDALQTQLVQQQIAMQLFGEGHYREAEKALRTVFDHLRNQSGPEHEETRRAKGKLANILADLANFAEAEELMNDEYKYCLGRFGPEHPETLSARAFLASLIADRGDMEGAGTILGEIDQSLSRIYGDTHPITLITRFNLIATRLSQGKTSEADSNFTEFLPLIESRFGKYSELNARAIATLAFLRSEEGRPEESEKLNREALHNFQMALGPEHPRTLHHASNFAIMLSRDRKVDEALSLATAAVEGLERSLGPEHPHLLNALHNLSLVHSERGEHDLARPFADRMLEISRKTWGDDSASTVNALRAIGEILLVAGRPAEAAPYLEEACDRALDVFPHDYPEQFVIGSLYGVCLVHLERFEEAETQLLNSYEDFVRVAGRAHRDTQWAATQVDALYERWGKPEERKTWRENARERLESATHHQ